ncbi:MAG: response regulator [Elusimicrobiota bacterium]
MAPIKVLVVDDEEDYRTILMRALSKAGYEVLSAGNGEDALRAFERERPALIVLDGNLPDIDGFEVCRRIRAKEGERKVLILFCTVRSALTPVAEGLRAGADDYVVKPFSVEDLLGRVRSALERR